MYDQNINNFSFNSDHKSFADKQKNLFEQLDNAAKLSRRTFDNDEAMEIDVSEKPERSFTKQFKRQESIFKRPEAPISRCLPIGKFRRNPSKWTKYTLRDVKEEDISEHANKNAALSFLRDLEKRKHGSSDVEKLVELPEKVTFKKTAIIISQNSVVDDKKVVFKQSKVVMPEYVVGEKRERNRKVRKTREVGSSAQLKLDHLDCDEE